MSEQIRSGVSLFLVVTGLSVGPSWIGPLGAVSLAQETPSAKPSLKEQLPTIPPLAPVEALKTFRLRDGFRMELLAHEPLVTDPVAMAYDENGVAYVVEMIDYPHTDKEADVPFTDQTVQKPIGRVRVLVDADGDGKFDRSTVFAEKLSWPTGVAVFKGGVFVSATPDIWYLKDTDGDHKADVRRKVFTGFRKFNVQAVMNNLKWGLDHKIYGAASGNGGTVRPGDQPDAKPTRVARSDFRFDPVHGGFEVISGGARFGNTFDDWGNRFICNLRNPAQHVVLPNRYLRRNPYLPVPRAIYDCAVFGDQVPVYPTSKPEPWRALRALRWAVATDRRYPRSEIVANGFVTSASGITVYRGSAYPERYRGNLFLGEVAGNLIHRQTLRRDGPTFVAKRADEKTEFVTSTDNWFRPVNFVNAPDGTLHVLDMYREIIEHPWSIPDDIKAVLDLRSGSDRGRIYRLTPPGFQQPAPPRLGQATVEQLVAYLASPNVWYRETAHRLLFERQDKSAIGPLRKLHAESKSPLARLHCLWSLEGLGALRDADLAAALSDRSSGVREHAVRLAEPRLAKSPQLLGKVLALADDADVRVRFQVAFTLGEVQDSRRLQALARIAHRDASNLWVRTAVLSSSANTADRLLIALLDDRPFARSEGARLLIHQLALIVGVRHRQQELNRTLAAVAAADKALQTRVLTGLGDGLKRAGKRLTGLTAGSASVASMLRGLMSDALLTARNQSAEPARRQRAVELLGYDEFDRVYETLSAMLDTRQPQQVQLAAVRALSGFRQRQVVDLLLEGWRSYTPAVRNEAVEAMLSRRSWIVPFLHAVGNGKAAVTDISPTRRGLLLKHRDTAVRTLAGSLFGGSLPSPRKQVIAEYKPALSLPGDRIRGRKVFQRDCMACHRHGSEGHDIGPNMATIKNRTPDNLLMHILDPNREVSPNYLEYVVQLDDGRVVTGVIVAETATSITLRRPENVEQTLLRQNVEEIASTRKSIMPEGFETKISHQEMADLVNFLLN